MLKILYVNAITQPLAGDILLRGVQQGLAQSRRAFQLDSYDIFYGAKLFPRQLGRWASHRSYDAVILSGSEKNTSETGDPWVEDYSHGLRELLDIRRADLNEWDGPPVPIFGICFGHQVLAHALGGEVTRAKFRVGGAHIRALPLAQGHPVFRPLLSVPDPQLKVMVFHGDQVVRMPRGFHALFTSDYCANQGMAHDRWPIVSLQSHPEMNEEIRARSLDRQTWDAVPAEDFVGNDGPRILGAFLDWVAARP